MTDTHVRSRCALAFALVLLTASALWAESAIDVVAPADVQTRETPAIEVGSECVADADCGACHSCDYGYCTERYWGDCAKPYGISCGTYHHCAANDDTCERRCELNDPMPADAVACTTDADCSGPRYCYWGFCEACEAWRLHECDLAAPASCGSYGRCDIVDPLCAQTRCVFDDPHPPGAVSCSSDVDCPRCHVCRWQFCERTCYACTTDADCRPEDHCQLHSVPMDDPWGVCKNAEGGFSLQPPPSDPQPDAEPDLDTHVGAEPDVDTRDDDAAVADPKHVGGGGCALDDSAAASPAGLVLLLGVALVSVIVPGADGRRAPRKSPPAGG